MFKIAKILGLVMLLMAFTTLAMGCGESVNSPTLAVASPTPEITSPTGLDYTSTVTSSSAPPVAITQPPLLSNSVSPTNSISPTSTLKVQDITVKAIMATEKITTLKFDMDFAMVFGLGTGGGTESINMQQKATAAVNIPDKKMAMTMDMAMEMPEEGLKNISAEIYMVDGWMYMRANLPDQGDRWSKMKVTDELWAQQSQLSSMTDFLKSPVSLELAGSETIRGIDCYVLSISPDSEALANWMAGQMQGGGGDLSSLENSGISQLFDNFAVKEWIAKDSCLPVRQQIAMKFANPSPMPSATPSTFDQMAMDINATIDYYDYNKTVNIDLPQEALNAQEIIVPE